jgi:hypothetical protein
VRTYLYSHVCFCARRRPTTDQTPSPAHRELFSDTEPMVASLPLTFMSLIRKSMPGFLMRSLGNINCTHTHTHTHTHAHTHTM